MEIVTGLACFGLDEKRFLSCTPCVKSTVFSASLLLAEGQKYAVEFFSLSYEQLNEEFAVIVVPLDEMIYIETKNFLLLKSFKSWKNLY